MFRDLYILRNAPSDYIGWGIVIRKNMNSK